METRRKIVLKFGSKSLVNDNRSISESIKAITEAADSLYALGFFPIIVSSGAVLVGKHEQPSTKSAPANNRRYFSSIGQSKIVEEYASRFRDLPENLRASQILISRRTFANREVYNSIYQTLEEYARDGVIPIVNNNDFTYDESHDFTDNDQLAAFVAILANCTDVVMFSDVNGIFKDNPKNHPDLKPIQNILEIENVRDDKSKISNGGIRPKIDSAILLNEFGINHTICTFPNIENLEPLLLKGKKLGSTFFANSSKRKRGIQRWLRAGAISKGIIVISDKGTNAITAVTQRKSLLQSGVEAIYGEFIAGDVVSIRSADFQPLSIGVTNYSSWQLLDGLRSRASIAKSSSHRDAVVSANYSAVKTREFFQNTDTHLVAKYISSYRKRFEAHSNSSGKIEIYEVYKESKPANKPHEKKKVLVSTLNQRYWLDQKDELINRKINLGISSWSDFWIFKFALEGDLLELPHWERNSDTNSS